MHRRRQMKNVWKKRLNLNQSLIVAVYIITQMQRIDLDRLLHFTHKKVKKDVKHIEMVVCFNLSGVISACFRRNTSHYDTVCQWLSLICAVAVFCFVTHINRAQFFHNRNNNLTRRH